MFKHMKVFFSICVTLLFHPVLIAQQDNDIVFVHVDILPMNKEKLIRDQTVIIRNGRIQSIRPTSGKKIRGTVINGTGKFLMPGLAEMHAHIPPVNDIEPMKKVLTLFLANGVTTIRGMLGHPLHLELRKKVADGNIFGPNIITSGPSFNGNSVATPADGALMVHEQKKMGYDFLKLHPGLSKEKFLAITKAAYDAGIPFAGHVSFDVGVWMAISSGYTTIDHMDGFIEALVPGIEHMREESIGLFAMYIADHADTAKIPSLINALKENNIWVVPTEALSQRWFSPLRSPEELAAAPEMVYMDKKTVTAWKRSKETLMANASYDQEKMIRFMELRKKLIRSMSNGNVGILLGSDAPQVFDVPGFSTHQELQYYVEAGLTPYEAIRTGTYNIGRFLKRDDVGIIRVGAVADLLLLDANPLEAIENTSKINGVMKNGIWYPKAFLDEQLEMIRKSNQQ
jgi:imidazolonepropionase-like amidohydrolase